MLAYFTASIIGKKHYLNNYLSVINTLKSKGAEVISNHILKTTEDQIRLETKEERIRFQNQLEIWIRSADFAVAETSYPSISVGYEISHSVHLGRPVLILYSDGHPPSLLLQHKDAPIVCKKYTYDNLEDIIGEFMHFAQAIHDTRFTFFISREIAAFLTEISKKEKLPKSVFLRNLIEDNMKNYPTRGGSH